MIDDSDGVDSSFEAWYKIFKATWQYEILVALLRYMGIITLGEFLVISPS